MTFSGGFDAMSGAAFLDTVGALGVHQREIDAQILVAAQEWAMRNSADVLDGLAGTGRRSSKTFRHYGGSGTPSVATSAGAEFGARLGLSSHAGDAYLADGLDFAYRLPLLWWRVKAGEVRASYARYVARKTRDLELDQAEYVDSRVAESADGRITWSRFELLVEVAIKAADPEAARVKEEKSRKAQFAKQTRIVTDGLAGFFIRADVATIAVFDATVAHVARVLKDIGIEESQDRLRVLAVALLANPAQATQLLAAHAAWKGQPTETTPPPEDPPRSDPDASGEPDDSEAEEPTDRERVMAAVMDLIRRSGWTPDGAKPGVDWRKLLPSVQLFVHVYAGEMTPAGLQKVDETGIARIEGYGPVTEPWIRDLLGPLAQFTVRPVLDLAGQAPVDAYDIPDRHRQAVRIMTPADVFPYSTANVNQAGGWTGMQIDHNIAWRPDEPEGAGQSRIGNYGPLTQFHHNLKTHGGWQVRQPFPGIYIWRDPHGGHYLHDHTGTRSLRSTRGTTTIQLDVVEYEGWAA